MKNKKEKLLYPMLYRYLRLLEKTVKITWEQPDDYSQQSVIGFWHEDSFTMNLLLRKIIRKKQNVSLLADGDERGDHLQYLLEKSGGSTIRMKYDSNNIKELKAALEQLKAEKQNIVLAMDGPSGPRHIPKNMGFYLSKISGCELVKVHIDCSAKLSLGRYWDYYKIPLPFSKIIIRFENYGVMDKEYQGIQRKYAEAVEGKAIFI